MKLRSLFGMCFAVLAFTFASSTFAADFTYSLTVVKPSLPFTDAGYTTNGSITVTVTNDACTPGTYTVGTVPVNNSAPDGSTPPGTSVSTYIGFPQGNFLFDNAGVGDYNLTITETSGNVGCVSHVGPGAQQTAVVTVSNTQPLQGGKVSSINTPTPAPVDMMEDEMMEDEMMEDELMEDEMIEDEMIEDEMIEDELMEEVMLMEVCDAETILAYQEELMMDTTSTEGNVYAEMLGNVLAQVKLYLNRYLDRAESETEKNEKVMALVCKIEKVKSARVEEDYTHIDYLLQYIQDLAILKFVK